MRKSPKKGCCYYYCSCVCFGYITTPYSLKRRRMSFWREVDDLTTLAMTKTEESSYISSSKLLNAFGDVTAPASSLWFSAMPARTNDA